MGRLSFSKQIAIGLTAGLAAGLLLGERLAVLKVGADVFIQLLQMTVLPYVIVSLVGGLGRLSKDDLKRLALRGTSMLLLLWLVGLTAILATRHAFPQWESASFFSSSLREGGESVDLLKL